MDVAKGGGQHGTRFSRLQCADHLRMGVDGAGVGSFCSCTVRRKLKPAYRERDFALGRQKINLDPPYMVFCGIGMWDFSTHTHG